MRVGGATSAGKALCQFQHTCHARRIVISTVVDGRLTSEQRVLISVPQVVIVGPDDAPEWRLLRFQTIQDILTNDFRHQGHTHVRLLTLPVDLHGWMWFVPERLTRCGIPFRLEAQCTKF